MSQGSDDRLPQNSASELNADGGDTARLEPHAFVASQDREHAAWRSGRVLNELRYRLGIIWLMGHDDDTGSLWCDLRLLLREMMVGPVEQNRAENEVRRAHQAWHQARASEWYADKYHMEHCDLLLQFSGDIPPSSDDPFLRAVDIAREGENDVERLRSALWAMLPSEILPFVRLGLHADQILPPLITSETITFASLDPSEAFVGWHTADASHSSDGRRVRVKPRPHPDRPWDVWRHEYVYLRQQVGFLGEFEAPADPADVFAQLERELRDRSRSVAAAEESSTDGVEQLELQINPQTRRISRSGFTSITLAPRLCRLLRYIYQKGDETTTLTELSTNWAEIGHRASCCPGTVYDAISRLNNREFGRKSGANCLPIPTYGRRPIAKKKPQWPRRSEATS